MIPRRSSARRLRAVAGRVGVAADRAAAEEAEGRARAVMVGVVGRTVRLAAGDSPAEVGSAMPWSPRGNSRSRWTIHWS